MSTRSERYEQEAILFLNSDREACSSRMRTDLSIDLIHAALGICDESGEFCAAVKKAIYYGRELDKTNMIEELGDLLWYINLAANALGVNLDLVMASNIRKLRARYQRKFSEKSATDRDLERERHELEVAAAAYNEDDCVEF